MLVLLHGNARQRYLRDCYRMQRETPQVGFCHRSPRERQVSNGLTIDVVSIWSSQQGLLLKQVGRTLWYPSTCHNEFTNGTEYTRRWMACLQL